MRNIYEDISFQLHCYNSKALVLGWSHMTCCYFTTKLIRWHLL